MLGGNTPPYMFFQIKHVFHFLESIGSARIEGNHTSLAKAVDQKIEPALEGRPDEGIREIENMEKALRFIEENSDHPINRLFVSEIHKIITEGLSIENEGCRQPGCYRTDNVIINKSTHIPPNACFVEDYMRELFDFIADGLHSEKYHLIKIALSHHRFAWIHPFENGNGRTVRALTYAMLIQYGFKVDVGRILNPTAVFCNSRELYYEALSWADTGEDKGLLAWCEYVCKGLSREIEKIDNLLDYEYLEKKILLPCLKNAKSKNTVSDRDNKVLNYMIRNKCYIKTGELKGVLNIEKNSTRSEIIRKMKHEKLIYKIKQGYTINLTSGPLLRFLMKELYENDFIPNSLYED
jgi:Fic family protein